MNIKSKNGNITISGTDVKVGKDLNLNAKKDITIKASEENFTSGRGNGTNYVNSTIDVDQLSNVK